MTETPTRSTEVLSREESLQLLQEHSFVGRVAFVHEGRILVLPVNYLADESSVVFCTAPGSTLSALGQGADVAFEVDSTKALYHAGWSVLARGQAREVTDPTEIERFRRGPLRSWASPTPGHWIRIPIDEISGRRLGGY